MACQRKSSSSVKQQQEQLKDAASPTPPSPFEDTERYLWRLGCSRDLPEAAAKAHFLPDLIRKTLKVEVVERGRVSFSFPVIPQLTNLYNTLHGGAVAAVAEVAAQACLMTVAGDREFFLGESAVTYLSAARANIPLLCT
uniref:Ubiquitin-like modifier-activating enzyme ATG7 n=1 Tax=Anthurium amnicola TaxID=1678845 RepID=A0A1D1YE62_9ARAE